jgi:hypothetical protein
VQGGDAVGETGFAAGLKRLPESGKEAGESAYSPFYAEIAI